MVTSVLYFLHITDLNTAKRAKILGSCISPYDTEFQESRHYSFWDYSPAVTTFWCLRLGRNLIQQQWPRKIEQSS